jgi:hypothetical protein
MEKSRRVRASGSFTDIGRWIADGKGLASPILQPSHLEHSKVFNDGVLVPKNLHDQYATVIRNRYVVENDAVS